jgi:hypothetical protein
VKSERYFDLFDQVFAHHFEGAELPDVEGLEIDEMARACWNSGSRIPRPWPMPWAWMKTS